MREGVKQVFNRHARIGPEQCMKEDEDTADLSGSHTHSGCAQSRALVCSHSPRTCVSGN